MVKTILQLNYIINNKFSEKKNRFLNLIKNQKYIRKIF